MHSFSSRSFRLLLYALSVLLVIVALFLPVDGQSQTAGQQRKGAPEKRGTDPYSSDLVPEVFYIFDKKVPLYRDDLRERFERELFQFAEHRGLMTILVKRYFKYYSVINEEIQKVQAPSDLIFVVITESYLNPRAVSRAGASGMWQFMEETGKREGLAITGSVDERYHLKKAARAGIAHLKRLHGEFNDWFLALGAYNAGAQRIRDGITHQGTRDFFDMYLPEETERYVFRVMALKEIITNPDKYGILVYERELYREAKVSEITIEATKEIHTNVLSKAMDLPYKSFRDSNLHLRKYRLPPGTYHIIVPADRREIFIKRLQQAEGIRVVKTGP